MQQTEKQESSQEKETVLLERELVDRIAQLARLDPSEAERIRLQAELGRILQSFRKLAEVDTVHVEPVYHPQDLLDCLRPDQTAPSIARDQLLAPAGQQKDGFFVAPRTLE